MPSSAREFASGPTSIARPPTRRPASSSASSFAPASSPQTSASWSGGSARRGRSAESDCRPAATGAADQPRALSASEPSSRPGHDPGVGEAQVARDAEHRRLADRVRQARARSRARRSTSSASTTRSAPRTTSSLLPPCDAELERPLPRPLRVARADDDVLAERAQPPRERAAEGAGAADDRDLHCSAAAVRAPPRRRRRRPSASSISVRVTIGRTPALASSASASSITSASIRPV